MTDHINNSAFDVLSTVLVSSLDYVAKDSQKLVDNHVNIHTQNYPYDNIPSDDFSSPSLSYSRFLNNDTNRTIASIEKVNGTTSTLGGGGKNNENRTTTLRDIARGAAKNTTGGGDEDWNPQGLTDGEILTQTLMLYGNFFLVCLFLFCLLRKAYPKAYNLRSGWISQDVIEPNPRAQNPDAMGRFSWLWKVWFVADTELSDDCGMDALCLSRVLEWGARLTLFGSLVGCILLMPVYATADGDYSMKGGVEELNTSNVPDGAEGRGRFLATVLAAYLIFGYTMYSILHEFEWFYTFRYEFLSRPIPRNYTVYVRNLSEEYWTSKALEEYFSNFEVIRSGYHRYDDFSLGTEGTALYPGYSKTTQQYLSKNAMKARVALKIPKLSKMVAKRVCVLQKLEHAINVEDILNKVPKTIDAASGLEITVVDYLFGELKELNKEITTMIETIDRRSKLDNPLDDYHAEDYQNPVLVEGSDHGDYDFEYGNNTCTYHNDTCTYHNGVIDMRRNGPKRRKPPDAFFDSKSVEHSTSFQGKPASVAAAEFMTVPHTIEDTDHLFQEDITVAENNADLTMDSLEDYNLNRNMNDSENESNRNGYATKSPLMIIDQVGKVANAGISHVGKAANLGIQVIGTQMERAAALVSNRNDDGAPTTAAFVTFSSLMACQAAKQMMHSRDVFGMEVIEAPGCDDILWKNVGKEHKELQMGLLLSILLTSTLCLFWTIVITFISTLSSVEGLTGLIPELEELLQTHAWLYTLLAQISPLMIVLANSLLRVILEALSGLEGHVSNALIQASLFSKLSAFMIIQTFFVNAISGSLIAELSAIVQNPSAIIELLANSLPNRSSFFIQIMLVQTSVDLSMELLRISPVGVAFVRSLVGPKLTEDERRTTWMGLRPFADPMEFQHASVLSGIVFYFVVFFVYATLAPITSIFTFVCFVFMGASYRHQFIFIYPTLPDSGGKLWIQFMQIVPTSLIIGELTIVGFLALKTAPLASSLMIPLLLVTILFNIYIRQMHFAVTNFLPGCVCAEVDRKNKMDGQMHMKFLSMNQYKQPELRDKELYPKNASFERQLQHGILCYEDPETDDRELVPR